MEPTYHLAFSVGHVTVDISMKPQSLKVNDFFQCKGGGYSCRHKVIQIFNNDDVDMSIQNENGHIENFTRDWGVRLLTKIEIMFHFKEV